MPPKIKMSGTQEERAKRERHRMASQRYRAKQTEEQKEKEREYARNRFQGKYYNDKEWKAEFMRKNAEFKKEKTESFFFNLPSPYSAYMEYMKNEHGLPYARTVQFLINKWGDKI